MKSLKEHIFLPEPRKIEETEGSFDIQSINWICCKGKSNSLYPLALKLKNIGLSTHKFDWKIRMISDLNDLTESITLNLNEDFKIQDQGYLLKILQDKIIIESNTEAGIFYGIKTFEQIIRQSRYKIPTGIINDYPDFCTRGIMLDISRDKVPTMQTLFTLVDKLANWKINRLELYTEHTFAYRNHQNVWIQASPMTGEEILSLDKYCQENFIELVPNQNSFGHMRRWLDLPEYKSLAECPDGFVWPWGEKTENPFSLCPILPESLKLLEELYDELLPHFKSNNFNVGCDETFDLGQGKSKSYCEKKGKGKVYLEFLLKIYKLVKKHNKILHFWGDIILDHPDLVKELPRDIVVLNWGYEADHPFEKQCAQFAEAGIPYFVCPGTSSWCSITGRTDNCLENQKNAAYYGLKYGASGILNTDWGDFGHWQYLPISYPGFVRGAALSWCYQSNLEKNIIPILNLHVYKDPSEITGKLIYDLGNAYQKCGHIRSNGSTLFSILRRPLSWKTPDGVTEKTLRETENYILDISSKLTYSNMQCNDSLLIKDELKNASRMLIHACRSKIANFKGKSGNVSVKNELTAQLREIIGEHRRLWLTRNRIGGLADSTKVLENRLDSISNAIL